MFGRPLCTVLTPGLRAAFTRPPSSRWWVAVIVLGMLAGVYGAGMARVEDARLRQEAKQELLRISTVIDLEDLTELVEARSEALANAVPAVQEALSRVNASTGKGRRVILVVDRRDGTRLMVTPFRSVIAPTHRGDLAPPGVYGPTRGWGTGWVTVRVALPVESMFGRATLTADLRREDWNLALLLHALGSAILAITLALGLWSLRSIYRHAQSMTVPIDTIDTPEMQQQYRLAKRRAVISAGALVVTLVVMVWVGTRLWAMESTYRQGRAVDLRMQLLVGELRRLDEVLSMSARLGIVTREPSWFHRYDANLRHLGATLREARALDAHLWEDYVHFTGQANRTLARIEQESRELMMAGQGQAALARLDSGDYREAKQHYSASLASLTDELGERLNGHADQFHHEVTQVLAGLVAVLLALVANVANLVVAMRHASDVEGVLRRNLARARDQQEALVEERTATLRASEGRLSATLHSIGDAVIATDAEGRITDLNRVAQDLTGWTLDRAYGVKWDQVVRLCESETTGLGSEAEVSVQLIDARGGARPVAVDTAPIVTNEGVELGTVIIIQDLTDEQVRAREVAVERQRLVSVLRGTNAGIWHWELEGDQWTLDAGWAGLLHATAGPTALNLFDLVHPDDRDRLTDAGQLHRAGVVPMLDCEVRFQHPVFEWLWVHLRGCVDHRRTDGTPLRLSGTVTDISARKQAEQSLRESEYSLRMLFEGSGDPILLIREGRITQANVAALQSLRCEHLDELVGLTPYDLSPEFQANGERSETLDQHYIQSAIREGSCRFEWVHRRVDGTDLPVEVMLTYLSIQDKPILHVMWRDTTERLRMEQDLRSSEQRFRSLFRLAPVGIFYLNVETLTIEDANEALLDQIGYSRAGLIGQPIQSWVPEAYQDRTTAAVETLRRTGRLAPIEMECLRADGSSYPVLVSSQMLRDPDGVRKAWTVVQDISQRVADEEALRAHTRQLSTLNTRLEALATRDPLTHLVNRRRFMEMLDEALATSVFAHSSVAVLFLDLDNFKYVNDSLGHEAGDLLLKDVAQRMVGTFRPGDVVARLGGDEFAVILSSPVDLPTAGQVAERLVHAMEVPFVMNGQSLSATVSVGVAISSDGVSVETLLQNADTAMYYAKHHGKSNWRAFEPWMVEAAQARLELEAALREAWQRREFSLHYQPIVDLTSQRLHDVEVLLRWNHPTRGMVSPLEFIPLAEEIGLIAPLGLWVLEQACERLQEWSSDPTMAHVRIAVNVSGHQVSRPSFLDDVRDVLKRIPVDPTRITLEITESAIMVDLEATTTKLNAIREMGMELAIDDFGTGYSSMGTLANLPVNTVKIDRSFIADVGQDLQPTVILRTLANLCRVLKLNVVAEGIENEDQFSQASALGCQYGQGYLFARPMPEAQLREWAQRQRDQYAA